MKFFKFLIGLVALSLTSCASEPILNLQESAPLQNEEGTKVSLDEALLRAEEFFAEIEGETRAAQRVVSSVEIIKQPTTRGVSSPDTLLYLVNYGTNEGFALLGSDERMHDIYAISPEGHMDYKDKDELKALEIFFDNAIAHAEMALNDTVSTRSLIGGIVGSDITSKTVTLHEVKPLITTPSVKWGQLSPFNRYTFTANNEQSYPGCLPVAAAIYMSFYRWPESYNGFTYNWTSMLDNNNFDEVAKFLKNLGQADLVNCKYTTDGANARNEAVERTFRNLNYYIDSRHVKVNVKENFDQFMKLLRFGNNGTNTPSPVLITATRNVVHGHAFVIDGEISRAIRKFQGSRIISEINMAPLLHIVWGWEGRFNGYFVYDSALNTVKDYVADADDEEYQDMELPETAIYYDYTYFGGFYPLK